MGRFSCPGARGKIFWPDKISLARGFSHPWTARRFVLVSAPAKGLRQANTPPAESGNSPQPERLLQVRGVASGWNPATAEHDSRPDAILLPVKWLLEKGRK